MLGRDALPTAVAGLAAGIVLAVVVTVAAADAYRATALVQIAPAADPRRPSPDSAPVAAEVLAESYATLVDSRPFLAQLAPRVASGELDAAELDARVRVSRPDGSSLVKVTATRSSPDAAEFLAGEVANALVTLVRQLEAQRALSVETALRGRMDELQGALRRARDPTRLEALRAERQALSGRLADAVAAKSEQGSVAQMVGPSQSAEQVRPYLLRNLVGGALLGLVVALGLVLLGERRQQPAAQAPPEPEPVAAPTPDPAPEPPSVSLAEPAPETVLAGVVRLVADVSADVERVQFLISNGSPEWTAVADAPPRLKTASWNTTTTPDGGYWLCAVASNGEGQRSSSEPVAIAIANGS